MAAEPPVGLRRYLIANMLDGDVGGQLTMRCTDLLDEVCELVEEWLGSRWAGLVPTPCPICAAAGGSHDAAAHSVYQVPDPWVYRETEGVGTGPWRWRNNAGWPLPYLRRNAADGC